MTYTITRDVDDYKITVDQDGLYQFVQDNAEHPSLVEEVYEALITYFSEGYLSLFLNKHTIKQKKGDTQ